MGRSSALFACFALGCGPGLGPGPGAGATGSGSATAGEDAAPTASDTGAGSDAVDSTTGPPPPPPPELPDHCESGVLADAWLHIDGTELDERDALPGIGIIDGDLVIDRAPDQHVDFLECIVEIRGDLVLHDNDALTDVSGLRNVARIGGDLVVADNDALVDFDALTLVEGIEASRPPDPAPGQPSTIFHSVIFTDNAALQRINGLTGLHVVYGHLVIRDNPSLVSIAGLSGLQSLGLDFAVVHNPSLCISGVDAIGSAFLQPCLAGPPACEPLVPPPEDWTTIANNEGC